MACYKNETKHKCSKVVMIVSIAAIVMGFLTAVFGAMKSGDAQALLKKAEASTGKSADFNFSDDLGIPNDSTVGGMIIAGGIMCIITGIFGGLTVKFKKPYFAVVFVALSFIIGLLLLIGAAVALGPKSVVVGDGCATIAEGDAGVNPAEIYTNLVDANMCTAACPCDETHKAKWESVDGFAEMVFQAPGDKTFSDFKSCYEKNSPKGEGTSDKAKAWMEKTGIGAIKLMELAFEDEKCASMCKTPKFFFTRSIADGPPETDCLTAVVESMQSMPAGAVALLSGLALIVAGIGGFPLCTGFNDKNDDAE